MEQKDKRSLKNTSLQEMIGIPVSALVLGSMQLYKGMAARKGLNFGKHGFIGGAGLFAELNNPGYRRLVLPTSPTQTPMFAPMYQTNQQNFQITDNMKRKVEEQLWKGF